jgi:hypothetical protein
MALTTLGCCIQASSPVSCRPTMPGAPVADAAQAPPLEHEQGQVRTQGRQVCRLSSTAGDCPEAVGDPTGCGMEV